MDQNSLAPAGDSNIEGMVSDTISANFPQVTYLCENQKIVKIIFSLEFDVCGHDRWTTGIWHAQFELNQSQILNFHQVGGLFVLSIGLKWTNYLGIILVQAIKFWGLLVSERLSV